MKRPILLVFAMEVEGMWLIDRLDNKNKEVICGYKFYSGKLFDYPVVVAISGVGVSLASGCVSLGIYKYRPVYVINYGISGSTSRDIHVNDIVVGEKIININSYRSKIKKAGEGSNIDDWELLTFISGEVDRLLCLESDNKLLELSKDIDNNVCYGIIGSGDIWNREFDRINYLNKKYHIITEDMESFGIYNICNMNNVPVISIKIISDNILCDEEYDRNVGMNLESFFIKYLEKVVDNIKKVS